VKIILKILSLTIIVVGLFLFFRTKEVVHSPGIIAPNVPKQNISKKSEEWQKEDFNYNEIARFEITARILSIRFYDYDDMSEFCPADIAVGWRKMSDQKIIDKLDIKQQHRWYVYRINNAVIPQGEIKLNSSNIHVIPANEDIEDILDDLVKGNLVTLKGKLVNVNKIGQKWTWKTSTKRNDDGGGACEILWTESIAIIK